MSRYNLLVTLDSNYYPPLKVLLKSIFTNHPGTLFDLYIMYSELTEEELADCAAFCKVHDCQTFPIFINKDEFAGAPTLLHYTQSMYYRLLAFEFLPESVEKILYIDPDTLVINPFLELYEIPMEYTLYIAAVHAFITPDVTNTVNRIRLRGTTEEDMEKYFNSGVMMMNLPLQREWIRREDIFSFIERNKNDLLLPDQDVMNALYSKYIREIDDRIYNFDARYPEMYQVMSGGTVNMDWIIKNTAILHFCGKDKPWNSKGTNKLQALYKHYMQLTERTKY